MNIISCIWTRECKKELLSRSIRTEINYASHGKLCSHNYSFHFHRESIRSTGHRIAVRKQVGCHELSRRSNKWTQNERYERKKKKIDQILTLIHLMIDYSIYWAHMQNKLKQPKPTHSHLFNDISNKLSDNFNYGKKASRRAMFIFNGIKWNL